MKRSSMVWAAVGVVMGAAVSWAGAATLFYGGDPRFPGGAANQNNTTSTRHFTYRVYDDFQVATPGWHVTSLFANLGGDVPSNEAVQSASYEIRTGMSENNLGTLVAGGTVPATLVYQGASTNSFNLFRLQADLTAPFDLSPGSYWLTLVPNTNDTSGQLYLRDSNLGNGTGSPLRNGNSFTYSQFYFFPTTPPTGPNGGTGDYSLGIAGSVPEPALGGILAVMACFGGRRRQRV
ncbi:MAG: hypothetical protein JWM57_955 [Phycisphaerales bacterium]|nr:hypothetical protein [Phycisphaerales bacterium]